MEVLLMNVCDKQARNRPNSNALSVPATAQYLQPQIQPLAKSLIISLSRCYKRRSPEQYFSAVRRDHRPSSCLAMKTSTILTLVTFLAAVAVANAQDSNVTATIIAAATAGKPLLGRISRRVTHIFVRFHRPHRSRYLRHRHHGDRGCI